MNLSGPFIRRPVMTILVMATLLFMGIVSYTYLPVNALPNVDYPVITISASYSGADATIMANNIATPIEKQCMQIDGLTQIMSTNYSGTSTIACIFDLNTDLTAAKTDVSAALTRASSFLPSDLPSTPTYQAYNPSNSPIIYVALTSESLTEAELYTYANINFGQRINMIEGVSKVQVYGSPYAIRAKIDTPSLFAKGIGMNQVASTLVSANQNIPGGNVYNQFKQIDIIPQGRITTAQDYAPLLLAYEDSTPLRLEDVADVQDSTGSEDLFFRYWNKSAGSRPSVVVAVMKQSKGNTVAISEELNAILPDLVATLPPSIEVNLIYNSATGIKEGLEEVEMTLLIAFILVSGVIFLFMGSIRTVIIPVVTLPLSIIGSFLFLYIFGYSVDILSLLALTLVVGFLVDDAIVVLENIFRHIEMGKDSFQAGLDGSKQISSTVLSMTLCLAMVFIPLVFMPGVIGLMFREFSWTIVIVVLLSGLISLTLTPMMCSRMFKKMHEPNAIERMANKIFKMSLGFYMPILRWCLKVRVIPIVGGVAFFVLSVYLFTILPQDFIPTGGTGALISVTQAKEGTSPIAQAQALDELIDRVTENPYVLNVVAIVNTGGFTLPNQGIIFTDLLPIDERPETEVVMNEIVQSLEPVSEMVAFFKEMPLIDLNVGTGSSKTEYEYALSSLMDPELLYSSATNLMKAMQGFPEIFSEVTSDMMLENPEFKIHFLRDQMNMRGVTVQDIEKALDYSFARGKLMNVIRTENQYDFILQANNQYALDEKSLEQMYVSNASGDLVSMGQLVSIEKVLGPLTVNHIDQFTSVKIEYNLAPGVALGTGTAKLQELVEQYIPPGISHFDTGTTAAFKQTMRTMLLLLIIAILAIYLILGILYESFIVPITVLSALPGAGFGALITLLVFGDTLSIYSYVGIIMLIGIVMKNGIMLVEFAMENTHEGKTPMEAITLACQERFRPIIMTTIAAMMGAVPIAVASGSAAAVQRRPLGTVIIGGLLFSQLITFFFTPVIYYYLERFEQWAKRKKHG